MTVIKPKMKKEKSSLVELKNIINESKFSANVKNIKTTLYNNLVKNIVRNVDYILVAGVTFYLTKKMYSIDCEN